MGTRRFLHVLSASCLAWADSSPYRTGSWQLTSVEALTPRRGPVHRRRTNTSRSARLRSHSQPTAQTLPPNGNGLVHHQSPVRATPLEGSIRRGTAVCLGSLVDYGRSSGRKQPLGGTTPLRACYTSSRSNTRQMPRSNRSHKIRWKWSSCPHFAELHQPIHVHDESNDHMTPMWSRCKDALSASDSDTSSSEGPGALSATGGGQERSDPA